jgi:hypothetical protein
MRTILAIALLANVFLSVWSSNLQDAIAGQRASVSIGSVSVVADAAGQPAEHHLSF